MCAGVDACVITIFIEIISSLSYVFIRVVLVKTKLYTINEKRPLLYRLKTPSDPSAVFAVFVIIKKP